MTWDYFVGSCCRVLDIIIRCNFWNYTGKFFVSIAATHRRLDKTGFDLISPQRQGGVDPGGSVREVFDKLFLRTWRTETRLLRIFGIFSKVIGTQGFKDAARNVTKSLFGIRNSYFKCIFSSSSYFFHLICSHLIW